MINRKAAVIGSGGHWVATRGLRGLRLRVQCPEGAIKVLVQQLQDGAEAFVELCGPGVHSLSDAQWSKVTVLEGPGILAFFESEAA